MKQFEVYWENRQSKSGKDALKRSSTSVEVGDPSQGADSRADAAPVAVPPVLSGPQVVRPALVVGLVVQQPVAVHHVRGVEVGHAEAVLDVWAVVHQLVHLAGHVEAFVKPHSVGASVLVQDGKLCYYIIYLNFIQRIMYFTTKNKHFMAKKLNKIGLFGLFLLQNLKQRPTWGIIRQDLTQSLMPITRWLSEYSPLLR